MTQDVFKQELDFSPRTGDVQGILASPEYRAASEKGFLAIQRLAFQKTAELSNTWMSESFAGCEDTDAVIAGIGGPPIAESVAERLLIP